MYFRFHPSHILFLEPYFYGNFSFSLHVHVHVGTNAYNSHLLGWYKDREAQFNRRSPPTTVKLVGITDYKPAGDKDLPDDFYSLIKFD